MRLHRLTQTEFLTAMGDPVGKARERALATHKQLVKLALEQGESVPPNILGETGLETLVLDPSWRPCPRPPAPCSRGAFIQGELFGLGWSKS